jgi:hypothetical protein
MMVGIGAQQLLSQEATEGKTVLKQMEVVRTYRSTTPIKLVPPDMYGAVASPYPSTIAVSDLAGGFTLKAKVTLHGLTHPSPEHLRLALSSPGGLWMVLMSGMGGTTAVSGLEMTLDDAAANRLPQGTPLTSGTFRPACDPDENVFPWGLYPNGPVRCTFQHLEQAASSGEWRLWAHDEAGPYTGQVASGWDLELTARTTVRVKKKKKKRKH